MYAFSIPVEKEGSWKLTQIFGCVNAVHKYKKNRKHRVKWRAKRWISLNLTCTAKRHFEYITWLEQKTNSVTEDGRIIPENVNCSLNAYNTIQYNTIQYNTMQCNAMQYNTIQYNTIQYNKLYLKSERINNYNTSSSELLNPT